MNSRKNPKFDDGVSARKDFRSAGRKIDARKLAQLCTQVRRAIELALLGTVQDEALIDVEVSDVTPTNDPSRLKVAFVAHREGVDRDDLRVRLEAARGLFVAEVAQAITRKRVPDLLFELVEAEDC